ncbi:hypothetical protein TNCV_1266341 [Trichonephila clavipes]|nr:hypothetical protein TNCV_1266341 [Trichonephila clavipes]
MDEDLSDTFKKLRCAGNMTPEEKFLEIEVRGVWRPSNRSSTFNLPPGICGMDRSSAQQQVHPAVTPG